MTAPKDRVTPKLKKTKDVLSLSEHIPTTTEKKEESRFKAPKRRPSSKKDPLSQSEHITNGRSKKKDAMGHSSHDTRKRRSKKDMLSQSEHVPRGGPKQKDDLSLSSHDTRRRSRGVPTRKCPARCKSMPLSRLSNSWQPMTFGDAEAGPGMSSGPVKPIGAALQQGPWEKGPKVGVFGEKKEAFVGITRRLKTPVEEKADPQ